MEMIALIFAVFFGGMLFGAPLRIDSGRCVDVPSSTRDNGARMQGYSCNGTGAQDFELQQQGDWFKIVNRGNGKCLDIANNDRNNGAWVNQWQCFGGDNQLWKFDGKMIRSKLNNKCLDEAKDGHKLQMWDCFGDYNQRFTFSGGGGGSGNAEVWVTSGDQRHKLARWPDIQTTGAQQGLVINVDVNRRYQSMDGFGAAWTDSSAWLFQNKLSAGKKEEVMESLHGRNGIKLDFGRVAMGASDYAWQAYSYNDNGDWNLNSFSVGRDDPYIVPTLQYAKHKNSKLKLVASPWTAPASMKHNNSLYGGGNSSLKIDAFLGYARYFEKFVDAYRSRGLDIYAVTPQNEPLNNTGAHPAMYMSAEDQIRFINEQLGPKMRSKGVKIIAFDHNFNDGWYPERVLAATGDNVAGSGWHPYTTTGDHTAMSWIRGRFPNKDVWLTEASGGSWVDGGSWAGGLKDEMMHTIRSPRNWAKGVLFWNMALDQNNGPSLLGNSTSRGVLTIRSDRNDAVTWNVDYYALGQSSKFIESGSVRVESNDYRDRLENVAYHNPDGTVAVVMYNWWNSEQQFTINAGGKRFRHTIPAQSAMTVKFKI